MPPLIVAASAPAVAFTPVTRQLSSTVTPVRVPVSVTHTTPSDTDSYAVEVTVTSLKVMFESVPLTVVKKARFSVALEVSSTPLIVNPPPFKLAASAMGVHSLPERSISAVRIKLSCAILFASSHRSSAEFISTTGRFVYVTLPEPTYFPPPFSFIISPLETQPSIVICLVA